MNCGTKNTKATKNGDCVKKKNKPANDKVIRKLLKGIEKKSYKPTTEAIIISVFSSFNVNFILYY